jgi:hypothetical protein
MAVPAIFNTLQQSPLGRLIAESTWMFPTLETLHIFALATVIGSIVMVDVRLLGWASKERPVSALSENVLPWTWGAFALAVLSGSLLFTSRAADYMHLTSWYLKFVFMGLAAVNMAIFQFVTQRNMADWDTGKPVMAARVAGGLSLLFWGAVVICARKVGFSL